MTDIDVLLLVENEWQLYRDVRLAALRDAPEAFIARFEDEASYDDDSAVPPMYDDTERYPDRTDIMDCARQAEHALRRLARITINRPGMAPADIDVALAQLAEAVATLPRGQPPSSATCSGTHRTTSTSRWTR